MKKTAKKKKSTPLTESEWRRVFTARCQTKQGRSISVEERALINRAFETDPERYGTMDGDVFNATVPFGSTTRWK